MLVPVAGHRRGRRGALAAGPRPPGRSPTTAPPTGEATQAQVWVPRNGARGDPGQRLPRRAAPAAAGAAAQRRRGAVRRAAARGRRALQRPRRAHAVDGGVGGGGDPRRAARHPVLRARAGRRPLVVHDPLLARGRAGAGRRRRRHRPDDRPDARRLRRRAHLRGAHRAGRRPVDRRSCRSCCRTPTSSSSSSRSPRRPSAWSTPRFLAAMPDGALLVNAARGVGRRHRRAARRAAPRPAAGRAGRHRPRAAARRAPAVDGAGAAAHPARRR